MHIFRTHVFAEGHEDEAGGGAETASKTSWRWTKDFPEKTEESIKQITRKNDSHKAKARNKQKTHNDYIRAKEPKTKNMEEIISQATEGKKKQTKKNHPKNHTLM